jgi:hypothetical protein
VSGSPTTIADVVKLANAMLADRREPIARPCFMQVLQRPLAVLPVLSPDDLRHGN